MQLHCFQHITQPGQVSRGPPEDASASPRGPQALAGPRQDVGCFDSQLIVCLLGKSFEISLEMPASGLVFSQIAFVESDTVLGPYIPPFI